MVPAVDVKSPMATSPRAWDFSAALEILSAPIASVSRSSSDTASRLEVSTDDISLSKANPSGESKNDALEDAPEVPILGNFDLVWDFLKSDAGPQHLSAYTVPETNHSSSPLLDSDIGDAPCLASNVSKDIGGFMKQRSGPTPSHKVRFRGHKKGNVRKFMKGTVKTTLEVHDSSRLSGSYADHLKEKANLDEEKRRKIMRECSEKSSTPNCRGAIVVEARLNLIPSSVASHQPSVLHKPDISLSVQKIISLLVLLSERFPESVSSLRACSELPGGPLYKQGIHVFVDISNVRTTRSISSRTRLTIPNLDTYWFPR